MAIITKKGHVSRAIDFYEKSNIYFAIGKTNEWKESDRTDTTVSTDEINDLNPPLPSIDSEIVDLIGMKRVERMYIVKPDNINGTLSYQNNKWKIVSKEDALNEGARWVYISSNIAYNELPINISYRIVAVTTGVKALETIPSSQYVLKASEIKDKGTTEIIEFRKPLYRDSDQREELAIIIEF